MSDFPRSSYYFASLRFEPETAHLVCEKQQKVIELTQFENRFLQILVKNAESVVLYEDLRREVWANWEGNIKGKAQTLKGNLAKKLQSCGVDSDFIQVVPKKGYRLSVKVEFIGVSVPKNLPAQNPIDSVSVGKIESTENNVNLFRRIFGNHPLFIFSTSLIYALLVWLAVILEIAYRFDVYGNRALWLGLPIVGFMFATTFGNLRLAEITAKTGKSNGWLGGLFILIATNAVLCFSMLAFLPSEPLTLIRDATAQPAFSAFFKNVFLYFLPMFAAFILVPFYSVALAKDKPLINPRLLLIIFGIALIYSIFTHFQMLDRLQNAEFHHLFVTLIFLRFIGYFGLALTGLIWFYQKADFIKLRGIAVQSAETSAG